MQIVVNHLTRMQAGFICVAGVDFDARTHVRPTLGGARLTANMWGQLGGPFDVASLVDLGPTRPEGSPPEVEDQRFEPRSVTRVRDLEQDEFWRLLSEMARPRLKDIFGDALRGQGRTCAVDEGEGIASLGCLLPHRASLLVDPYGTIRLSLADGEFYVSLPVTDLRLYERDFRTPRRDVIENLARRISRGTPVILAIGLARPWKRPGDDVPRHWAQVNNLYLEDDPTWRGA